MRGDTGGALGKTFSAAWRYGILTPKQVHNMQKQFYLTYTHKKLFKF